MCHFTIKLTLTCWTSVYSFVVLIVYCQAQPKLKLNLWKPMGRTDKPMGRQPVKVFFKTQNNLKQVQTRQYRPGKVKTCPEKYMLSTETIWPTTADLASPSLNWAWPGSAPACFLLLSLLLLPEAEIGIQNWIRNQYKIKITSSSFSNGWKFIRLFKTDFTED